MPGHYKFTLYLLMFCMFITMGGLGIIVPVMPAYLEMFDAGGRIYGLLIATFSFAQFVLSPFIGELSDKYGRKNFIIIGLIFFGSALILFGLANSLWLLFVSRLISGIGAAFVMPTILAYVGDVTPLGERGKGMSLIGAAISLGFTVGPSIGGGLSGITLEFPFYFAGSIALVAAVVSYFVLPNVEQKLNVPAGRPNQNTFHQLISSFKVPYFVFLIVVFTFSFGIANYQATMSLYLDDKFQYTPFLISVIFTVGGFAGVILQLFWMDKLFLRFGEMKIILFHLVVASITLVLLIYVNGFFIILTVASLNMIAATFIRPAVNTAISKMAGDEQGFAAGMNNAYMSLGNMVGPICAGMLYDWKIDSPYLFGAFVLFSCFILTYFWSMKKSAQQKLQSSNP
ncbi:MFS transporter [Ureibacillus sp. 179-F W5.1 NHS]|uniref:MFS transporter n=1 Tax=Ureibacillus sp. 179-F W5.1 NHS TaxID=3374297 RepID=UPI00387A3977